MYCVKTLLDDLTRYELGCSMLVACEGHLYAVGSVTIESGKDGRVYLDLSTELKHEESLTVEQLSSILFQNKLSAHTPILAHDGNKDVIIDRSHEQDGYVLLR